MRRTARMDPDVKALSKDATVLLAKATELFVGLLARKSAYTVSLRGARQIKASDVVQTIYMNEALEFLRIDFPRSSVSVRSTGSGSSKSGAAGLRNLEKTTPKHRVPIVPTLHPPPPITTASTSSSTGKRGPASRSLHNEPQQQANFITNFFASKAATSDQTGSVSYFAKTAAAEEEEEEKKKAGGDSEDGDSDQAVGESEAQISVEDTVENDCDLESNDKNSAGADHAMVSDSLDGSTSANITTKRTTEKQSPNKVAAAQADSTSVTSTDV